MTVVAVSSTPTTQASSGDPATCCPGNTARPICRRCPHPPGNPHIAPYSRAQKGRTRDRRIRDYDLLRLDALHASRLLPHPDSIGTSRFADWTADHLEPFSPLHRGLVENLIPSPRASTG